ncbi:MAG: 16S rRNA (cytidine(1402)-2'-O)-methyltransferase, partial [Acidimicrobiales bacterium]
MTARAGSPPEGAPSWRGGEAAGSPAGGGAGALVLVATPIGNLLDLSPRAARALSEADVIACEDTRRTRKLLTHAGITGKRLLAVHDHNEAGQVGPVLAELDRGAVVAVVSDAGTPAVSDPGARLAAAAAAAGARVSVVPGPSAAVAALVVSGLPTGRWCFEGFLPRRGRERAERLAAVATDRRTTVIYEAPHRLAATLAALSEACGPVRHVAVVRELTKVHEEVWRGTLAGALARTDEVPARGEHTIVLAGAPEPSPPGEDEVEEAVAAALAGGRPAREAAAAA